MYCIKGSQASDNVWPFSLCTCRLLSRNMSPLVVLFVYWEAEVNIVFFFFFPISTLFWKRPLTEGAHQI